MTGRKTSCILCILFVCIGVQNVLSADVKLTSVINDTNITLNDQIMLTVTVSGADANKAGAPELDPMSEFTVRNFGTSTNTTINNMKVFREKVYTYALFPEKPGIFSVGAVSVKVGRDIITAPATKVKVISGPKAQTPVESENSTTQSSGNINLFITTDVDKKEAYVGEQITFTFELYSRISISSNEYEPPATTGFWVVDLPQIPATRKKAGNNIYTNNTIKKALFPTTSGELTVGPASFIYSAQRSSIQRLIIMSSAPKRLLTEPIAITVKPLPAKGKPAGFNGAVGNFEISSSIDNTTVKVGDVVTIWVSVSGTGNLDVITSLGEADLSAFKTYDPKITEKISNSGFVVGGLKTWEYVIIPKEQGDATVGPFSLSFFNPGDNSYYTVSTQSYTLNVEPSDAVTVADAVEGIGGGSIQNIAADIRYLKPAKNSLGSTGKRLYTSFYFYLVYIMPLAVLITSFVFKRRQDAIERNTGLKRKLNAFKHAQKRLDEAAAMLKSNDMKVLCGKLHEAILFYIGDMLNVDTGTLTSDDLENVLIRSGAAPEFAEHIRKTMEMCDFVRFASVGEELELRGNIVIDTRDIIAKLKDTL